MFGLIVRLNLGTTQFIKEEKNQNLAKKSVLLKKKILRKDPFNMWYMKVILIQNVIGFDPKKIPNLEDIIGSVPP